MTDLLQGSELIAGDGRRVRLGAKLGQGGEGTVFDLAGEQGLVAKIFRGPLSAERADKIRLMTGMRSAQMDAMTAWPIELLALPSGEAIGLSMAKVAGARDIHQLYSPKSRRLAFPGSDWRFLVKVAADLSRAFAVVHEGSNVIADVNHGGILVDQDGRVRLIDCDSFQISAGGKRFLCDVGVPTFTPPELQGRSFAGLLRSPNHDNFGLAVLVFLLLFMGRHPFAGRFAGKDDMSIERAIAEHRFAFGAGRKAAEMEPPPGAPPLAIVSPPVEALFERAFAADAADKGRPVARDWAMALDRLHGELAPCRADDAHWYWNGLATCPWCAVEAATGVPLFSDTVSPMAAGLFDLPEFWRQVRAVEHPGPAPKAEWGKKVAISEDVRALRRRRMLYTPVALLVAALPVALMFAIDAPGLAAILVALCAIPLFVVVRKVLRSVGDTSSLLQWMLHCRNEWETARREWDAKAGPGAFEAKQQELDKLRAEWEGSADLEVRQQTEGKLRRALNELQQIRNQIVFARTSLKEKCELAHFAYLQSEADLRAIQ